MSNDIKVGNDGKDGKDGVDGKIGVNGKDGSAVVINGKDGSIGLNVVKTAKTVLLLKALMVKTALTVKRQRRHDSYRIRRQNNNKHRSGNY